MLEAIGKFLESKGMRIRKKRERWLEVDFPLGDGKTRVLDFMDMGDLFGVPVLRVAVTFPWEMTPETVKEIASNLVYRNHKLKVGHFAIADAGDSKFVLFLQHELVSENTNMHELTTVAAQIAISADDFEREMEAGAAAVD